MKKDSEKDVLGSEEENGEALKTEKIEARQACQGAGDVEELSEMLTDGCVYDLRSGNGRDRDRSFQPWPRYR